MSTLNTSIGNRMLKIRTKLNYPQTRIAAQLEIADRSYKNYELGKRELPIHTAVKFCELYEVDLNWLIYGKSADTNSETIARAAKTAGAISSYYLENPLNYSYDKAIKVGGYIFKQSAEKNSDPQDEANEYFSTT